MSEEKAKIRRPKYKTKKYLNEQGRHRANEILKCKKCKGKPKGKKFKLDNIEGERCDNDDCMQVLNYKL